MPERTLHAAPEEGSGRPSGEEHILRPALPVAISIVDVQRLCFSWPQPLPLDTQPPFCYPVSLRLGVSGRVHTNDADICITLSPLETEPNF